MKTYEIFDVNRPLMDANVLISGTSPVDAARRYLKSIGVERQPKRSGDNYVQISAREYITSNGTKYYKGNTQWYELI